MARLVQGLRTIVNQSVKSVRLSAAPRAIAQQRCMHSIQLTGMAAPALLRNVQMATSTSVSNYATHKSTTLDDVKQRVLQIVHNYDKITADKLTEDSHFINDLGLDSLDHVEVIMAMEDEFGFEIPDSDAERLFRPKDIVQYIADKEDIYE